MDFLICQTSAASPAEPGELLFWFSLTALTKAEKVCESQILFTMPDRDLARYAALTRISRRPAQGNPIASRYSLKLVVYPLNLFSGRELDVRLATKRQFERRRRLR
jgi:hypothetical protein